MAKSIVKPTSNHRIVTFLQDFMDDFQRANDNYMAALKTLQEKLLEDVNNLTAHLRTPRESNADSSRTSAGRFRPDSTLLDY